MKFYPTNTNNLQHFRALSKKLGKMVKDGSFFQLNQEKQLELRMRLANLYRRASGFLSNSRLRRVLASSALLIGLATSAQAQAFASPVPVGFNLVNEETPVLHFADIDADGDQDAFFSYYGEDGDRVFAYQKNIGTGTVASFDTIVDKPFSLPGMNFLPTTVDFADVDNDGDLDLFMGSYGGTTTDPIFGWENTGTATTPSFNLSPATNPFNFQPSNGISEVTFADLDGDADMDILMNDYVDEDSAEQFRYQENLGIMGTFPQFGPVQINPFGLKNERLARIIIDAADIDKDGDVDLLVGGRNETYTDTDFFYYENTGTATAPVFAEVALNPFGLIVPDNQFLLVPALVDIDGDDDLDVIATTWDSVTDEESVMFWENLGYAVGTEDISVVDKLRLYPTVADEVINWETQMKESTRNTSLQIVDIHSRVRYVESRNLNADINQGSIDIADLNTGMYIFNITDKEGKNLLSRRFFVN